LFVMPVPLMVNEVAGLAAGLAVMVKGFVAKALNVMAATSVLAETKTEVNVVARLNVAVSDTPLGTVLGVQSVAVFQSEPVSFHAALPAKVLLRAANKSNVTVARSNDVCGFLEKLNLVFMLILHRAMATPQTLWTWMLGKVHALCQVVICDC